MATKGNPTTTSAAAASEIKRIDEPIASAKTSKKKKKAGNQSPADATDIASITKDVQLPSTGVPDDKKKNTVHGIAPNKEKRDSISELVLRHYKENIKPLVLLNKIAQVLKNSLDPQHIQEYCHQKNKFMYYVNKAELALRRREWKIEQCSAEILEVIEELELPRQWSEEQLLQALRERLFYEGLGYYELEKLNQVLDLLRAKLNLKSLFELIVNQRLYRLHIFNAKMSIENASNFDVPDTSDIASDLILRLDLDRLDTNSEQIQAIHKHLITLHQGRYGAKKIGEILNKLFASTHFPKDIRDLLKLCAKERQFRLWALQANVAISANQELLQPSFSEKEENLILKLELDKHCTPEEWKQPLREFLLDLHQQRYGRERLGTVLDKLIDAPVFPKDVRGILDLCMNERKFQLWTFRANVAMDINTNVVAPAFTENEGELITQLELDKVQNVAAWTQPLRAYLIRIHQQRFDSELLGKILDKICGALSTLTSYYEFLAMSANALRFLVHATGAQLAIQYRREFSMKHVSNEALQLFNELNLFQLQKDLLWQKALRDYLTETYTKQYDNWKLRTIVDKIFSSPQLYFDMYSLLDICANPSRSAVYVALAEYATDHRIEFTYEFLTDKMMDQVRAMELVNQNVAHWKQAFRQHLFRMHRERYGDDFLNKILDQLFKMAAFMTSYYRLLQMSGDLQRFDAYASIAAVTARENTHMFPCEPISDVALVLFLQLKLASLPNSAQWKNALWDYAVRVYQGQYEHQLNRNQYRFLRVQLSSKDFYGLLEACANKQKFQQFISNESWLD